MSPIVNLWVAHNNSKNKTKNMETVKSKSAASAILAQPIPPQTKPELQPDPIPVLGEEPALL